MSNNKIKALLNIVLNEMKQKNMEFIQKDQEIKTTYESVKKKELNHIQQQCKEEFEWFTKNGTIEEKAMGFDLTYNENVNKDEASKHIKAFQDCVKKNNLGLHQSMVNGLRECVNIENNFKNCVQECEKLQDEKLIKDCIRNCADIRFTEMFISMDQQCAKINEITKLNI
jgi:hypothetical protein